MVNQYVWVGITVGVFVAGIGIGFAVLQSTTQGPGPMNFGNMSPQQMIDAMQDPDFRQNMMNEFRNNPQSMGNWMGPMMNDPELQSQMRGNMMQNSQFMQGMMGPMSMDPSLREQMMQTMMNDPQMMEQMQTMMGSGNMMMNQGMTGRGGMMMQGSFGNMMENWQQFDPQTTPSEMQNNPQLQRHMFDQMSTHHNYMTEIISTTNIDEELKSQVLQHISSHNVLIEQMRDSYPTDPEVQQKIHDHMVEHHELMQTLNG